MQAISNDRLQFNYHKQITVYSVNDHLLKVRWYRNKTYGALNFPKMQQNIARISALASKMGQIKKIKALY